MINLLNKADELINPFLYGKHENTNVINFEIDFNDDRGGFNLSSSENTYMNDVVQEMHDSVNAVKKKQLSQQGSENWEPIRILILSLEKSIPSKGEPMNMPADQV